MGNIYGNKFYSIYFNLNFPNCNVSLCAIEIGLNRGRLGFIRPVYGGGQRWNNEGCDDSE